MKAARNGRRGEGSNGKRLVPGKPGPRTLAIDVGGTALKASVLDSAGRMVVDRVRVATPYPCPPKVLLDTLADLTSPLPAFDQISIGFPGVVRNGRVLTAPHFGQDEWHNYPLEAAISHRFGRPARLLNDAEIQGLGIISGRGLEVVLTLGTGVGSAIFSDGWLAPHLELAQHPIHNDKTYNEYIGNAALRRHGKKRWNQRVLKAIETVDTLTHYDKLYIGGGNAQHITAALPKNVHLASNDTGITGGIRLWDETVWQGIRGQGRSASSSPATGRSRRPRSRGRSHVPSKPAGKLS